MESKGLPPVLETLKASRALALAPSLRFTTGSSRPLQKKDSGNLLFGPSAHFTRVSQSAADRDTRFRGSSNDVCRERCRGYSFQGDSDA